MAAFSDQAVTALTFPVFFQAVASSLKSSLLTVIRSVMLFVPLGYLFSKFVLNWFWMTFPVTEVLISVTGIVFYRQFLKKNSVREKKILSANVEGEGNRQKGHPHKPND